MITSSEWIEPNEFLPRGGEYEETLENIKDPVKLVSEARPVPQFDKGIPKIHPIP
jgi:hypothetical protein